MSKIIGILGGMGPLASVDLQQKIILNTKVASDREHLHVITDCNTNIPDRTRAILEGGDSALPEMAKSAKRLAAAGAQVLIIACNTAHYYLEDLEKQVDVLFLSIIDAALNEVERQGAKKVSLLATKGTYKTALYQNKCEKRSILCIEPEQEDKDLLMEVIYDVKAGNIHEHLDRMKGFLDNEIKKGAELFILACTELPIYFSFNSINAPVVDPTLALALEAIAYAGAEAL